MHGWVGCSLHIEKISLNCIIKLDVLKQLAERLVEYVSEVRTKNIKNKYYKKRSDRMKNMNVFCKVNKNKNKNAIWDYFVAEIN